MTNRSRPDVVPVLLILLSRTLTITGWPTIVTLDVTLVIVGKDPFHGPLHDIVLAGLVIATMITVKDWGQQRSDRRTASTTDEIKEHFDHRLNSLSTQLAKHNFQLATTLDQTEDLGNARAATPVARGVVSASSITSTYRSAGSRRRSRRRRARASGPRDIDKQWESYQAGWADGRRDDPESSDT
jgi:hypothetical protein